LWEFHLAIKKQNNNQMKMKDLNRRNFIKKSSVFSAGLGSITIIPTSVWAAKVPPSDQINVALIGARSRGFQSLEDHKEYKGTNCVALCDIDSNILNERAEKEVRRQS
jgi:hypothetical protein